MNATIKEMIEVFCTNTQTKFLVPSGTALRDVIAYAGIENPEKILGATVNNKVERLDYKIYSPRTVNFLDNFNANGKRMYALSLMFLCYKAVKDIYPEADLQIMHSMNDGYYTEILNCKDPIEQAV